ncbi:hypothetical protein EOL96_00300 [Candidatus Saccharibacteria bacterium]|nr:hypothetical protein [Candidatus Saccharibacteria bacterium]
MKPRTTFLQRIGMLIAAIAGYHFVGSFVLTYDSVDRGNTLELDALNTFFHYLGGYVYQANGLWEGSLFHAAAVAGFIGVVLAVMIVGYALFSLVYWLATGASIVGRKGDK